MYKTYVIFDTDNDCQICVSLTENEASWIKRTVRTMMSLEQAIEHAEEVASQCMAKSYKLDGDTDTDYLEQCAAEHLQLAEWLSILKKAKFEYDEAWKIITHPTPDVTYADRDRAQTILDVFKDSLGRMEC